MPKLNQIIAVEKGVKNSSQKKLTESHKRLQKNSLLTGLSRVYRPKDEEGEELPREFTQVQLFAQKVILDEAAIQTDLFDIVASKDYGNCEAKADVVVDDQVLLRDVPVTYLLFLEKKLVDLKVFITKLPVLDQSEKWVYDAAQDCWASEPRDTTRTQKVLRNHVKSPATDKHPAQIHTYEESVLVGFWETTKYSGALPAAYVNKLSTRVEKLQRAVKFAREAANSLEVERKKVGDAFFGYLFSD